MTVKDMGFRLPNLLSLHEKLTVNIFILSYRGYGESEGNPDEDGLKVDAMAALDYVIHQRSDDVDEKRLFLFGRSLGGAVAIYAVWCLVPWSHCLNAIHWWLHCFMVGITNCI